MSWVKRGLIWVKGKDNAEEEAIRQQGIRTLVTWHDVTGGNATPPRLRELASRLTADSLVLFASALTTILANRRRESEKSKLDDQVSGALYLLPPPIRDAVVRMLTGRSHQVWFHDEQLLVLAKLGVLYGSDGPPAWDAAIGAELLLGINDILGSAKSGEGSSDRDEERRLLAFMIRRLGLLQNEAPRYLIGRYYDLLVTRGSTGQRPDNLGEDFVSATGIKLEEFFAFALVFAGAFSQFSNAQQLTEANFRGIGLQVESSIKDEEVRRRVSAALSTDRTWQRGRFASEREVPEIARSAFLPFQQKPLYRLSSGSLVPLIYPFLLDKTSLGIYWILQDYFAKSDPEHGVENLRSRLGGLHQEYITNLLSRAYKDAYAATFHPEVELTGPNKPPKDKEGLPDGIIHAEQTVVILEMSVTALTYGLVLAGDVDRFQKETAEKIRPKLDQLQQAIDDLIHGRSTCPGLDPKTIRHVIPVLVLLFPFPQHALTWTLLQGAIQTGPRKGLDSEVLVYPPQIITDEELEMLEPYIAGKGLSISGLLQRKVATLATRWTSMKNYMILAEKLPELENRAMRDLYDLAAERAKAILRIELNLAP